MAGMSKISFALLYSAKAATICAFLVRSLRTMVVHRACKSSAVTVLSSAGIDADKGGEGGAFWLLVIATVSASMAVMSLSILLSIVILVSFYLWFGD